jgi:creatinine amidohydrolase
MGHACEWETSMMLRIAPHLVGDFAQALPVEPGRSFLPATRAWTTRERSATGHIGWPHLATEEKGEMLLERFASEVSAFLERVIAWDGSSWNG